MKFLSVCYLAYYHDDRTHPGLDKQTPASKALSVGSGQVISRRRLGGAGETGYPTPRHFLRPSHVVESPRYGQSASEREAVLKERQRLNPCFSPFSNRFLQAHAFVTGPVIFADGKKYLNFVNLGFNIPAVPI